MRAFPNVPAEKSATLNELEAEEHLLDSEVVPSIKVIAPPRATGRYGLFRDRTSPKIFLNEKYPENNPTEMLSYVRKKLCPKTMHLNLNMNDSVLIITEYPPHHGEGEFFIRSESEHYKIQKFTKEAWIDIINFFATTAITHLSLRNFSLSFADIRQNFLHTLKENEPKQRLIILNSPNGLRLLSARAIRNYVDDNPPMAIEFRTYRIF